MWYLYLTVRVCTTKRFFSEHVFIKISYCVFKIMILKMKQKTGSFLIFVVPVLKVSLVSYLVIPVQVSYKRVSNKKGWFQSAYCKICAAQI